MAVHGVEGGPLETGDVVSDHIVTDCIGVSAQVKKVSVLIQNGLQVSEGAVPKNATPLRAISFLDFRES